MAWPQVYNGGDEKPSLKSGAYRRRWAASFTGQQQIERLRQGQRLSGIAANLSRFRGQ
jgi:hypothetical protein